MKTNDLDAALNRLRAAGHTVHITGPFSNGHRLIEVDEMVCNHHQIMALLEELDQDVEDQDSPTASIPKPGD